MTWATSKVQLQIYRELAKSGIVFLVLLSVLAGFVIGHSPEQPLDLTRLLLTLLAVTFLASGSSALNQLQERTQDALMPRTAGRPLPSGRLSVARARIFVISCLLLGMGLLLSLSLPLFYLGVSAVVFYNGFYTLWWKKHWAYAAVPGAIPGALPILMGYTSATGQVFAPGGIYLFSLLFFWQMPHFWSLALKYAQDYRQGGFPTLPVQYGPFVTRFQITLWCLAYVGIAALAPLFLPVGWIALILNATISLKVLFELFHFQLSTDNQQWLRFFLWINFSLIGYLAALALDLGCS